MHLLIKKTIILFLLLLFTINVHSLIYPITPKYASLKKNKTYLRYNASFQAPISHIYNKKGLPILIINEHDNWKKIKDSNGIEGWMHKSMISNRKTFINLKKQNLIKFLDEKNLIIAIIDPQVVGKIIKCEKIYCRVKVNKYKGWLKKEFLWGIKKD